MANNDTRNTLTKDLNTEARDEEKRRFVRKYETAADEARSTEAKRFVDGTDKKTIITGFKR